MHVRTSFFFHSQGFGFIEKSVVEPKYQRGYFCIRISLSWDRECAHVVVVGELKNILQIPDLADYLNQPTNLRYSLFRQLKAIKPY